MSAINRQSYSAVRILGVFGCLVALGGCSQTATHPDCANVVYDVHDPAEGINRKVFAFNRVADDYVIKPVAEGYEKLPQPVQDGVHNFVNNFSAPKVLVNDVLQGNGVRAMTTIGRFTINTLLGAGGVFDTAERMGLAYHDADFGQTFGVWGIGNGPAVEWPILGSANSRDSVGRVIDFALSPFGSGNSDTVDALDTAQNIGGVVDGRAQALPLTAKLERTPDYYSALRDNTGQRRAHFIAEGRSGQAVPSELYQRCGFGK
ncbi:VacJ family lipoprotein [Pseudomonas cichorii]|uniref:MlaA family lipoprotein n=1 Tax=Pseudomonas cichorii TaxID=36746 RepID=UPI0018E5EA8A|nr:VacJ family lipoprotein [Pseudomonas cichorii]MBI6853819.1 VacJ family lipoprotein [Pseudomonas cichorii]